VTITRHLTKAEVPNGTLLLWCSDVHVPIHHPAAVKLMIEAAEAEGVTRVIAGGDILDCNCLSTHPKEPERVLAEGTLLEEVEPGRWFLDWLATRPCNYLLGNHEDRLDRFIAKEALALYGGPGADIATLAKLPKEIEVHPSGSEIRLGNLAMVHGNAEFKKSTGGKYPAQRLLDMVPDQSTIAGHVHRQTQARWSGKDEAGIPRTRAAWTMGHMSVEKMHYGYVSRHPNWQMGFGFVRVWWDKDRPRFNVYQVEILFDRRNRPYFEYGGRVYK
jgi:hypothetical protein